MGDSIIGRNNDGTLNEDYSKWCYADGTYTYYNMDELLDICVKNMVIDYNHSCYSLFPYFGIAVLNEKNVKLHIVS